VCDINHNEKCNASSPKKSVSLCELVRMGENGREKEKKREKKRNYVVFAANIPNND